VVSVYFESGTDTDVRLYEVNLPTTYSCTFRNIVVDEDAGGQLTLTNTTTSSSETFNSGSSKTLNTNYNYSIKTLPRVFEDYEYSGQTGDYQHHHWKDGDNVKYNKYKLLKTVDTPLFIDKQSAIYEEDNTVSLSSSYPIEFHDPWYYDSQTQTQPDDYRTVSSGSFTVFLGQNSGGDPDQPIYSLKADKRIVSTSDILVFTGWSASNGSATFLDGSSSLETRVVFESANVTVSANYSSAIANGLTVEVSAGDTLTIPTGATYNITPGNFKIDVYGTLSINQSSSQQVTFQSNAGTPTNADWGGILIRDATVVMQNVTIKNAVNPLYIYGNSTISTKYINNCTIEDCKNGIELYQANYNESVYLNSSITIKNNVISDIGDADNENPGIRVQANIKTVEIDSNEIYECYGGIYLSCDFTSIQVSTYTIPSEILISHNVIHDLFSDDNTACGIKVIDNSTKSSPYTLPYGKIVNNTIDGIDGYGIYMDRDESGLWYVKNTIITEIGEWDSGAGYAVYSVGFTLPVKYCTIYAVEGTTYGCSTVSLIQDNPDYVSASDYHLQTGSPCIDTGDPDTDDDNSEWENDFNDRDPDGTRMDIGAFYCDYPPSTPTGYDGLWYNNHPKVYWTAVSDPDLDYYEVWKRRDGYWSLKTTTTSTNYVDNSETKWTRPLIMETIDYRVRSVDEGDNSSGYTSTESFIVNNVEYDKEQFFPTVEIDPIPTEFCLHPVFPNPFNITTTLKLDLPEKTKFSLAIYDIKGSEVWRLNNQRTNTYRAGYHTILWEGRNNSGSVVPTGVYFIVFSSPEHKLTQKVVLMK
ncbi:T9SS type A sorting domain-containing protein, partial [bacterium]|nr:T9SS type A sorting domain-containing protein [bacterium]